MPGVPCPRHLDRQTWTNEPEPQMQVMTLVLDGDGNLDMVLSSRVRIPKKAPDSGIKRCENKGGIDGPPPQSYPILNMPT
jgi:hypothetical protein